MFAAALPATAPTASVARVEPMRVSAQVLSGVVASKTGTTLHREERIRTIRERQANGQDVEIRIVDLE